MAPRLPSPVLEFGMRDGELRVPLGALSGRGLEGLLRRYTLASRQVRDFDSLRIAFRAVATDMESGLPVVLREGDLALALRSSMSVPGVFAPTEVGGRILGDGGLVDNLPIDVARAMGGQGSWYGARLALFWALASISPLMLLQGLVSGMIGAGPAMWLVSVGVAFGFLWLWLCMLHEVEAR